MRRTIAAALAVMTVWPPVLSIARIARGEEPAAARLRKPVDVNFVATPLERALEYVGRQANVAMVVDRKGLNEKARRFPVSLQAKRRPAGEMLDLLVKEAGVAYRLDGHVVFVTSVAHAWRDDVVMRIYDVRDLTADVPDFPGPELCLKSTPYYYAGGAGGLVIVGPGEGEVVTATTLAEMIRGRVRPEMWGSELGTRIEERGGSIVVHQTEEVHSEIEQLLAKFRAAFGPFLRIETKVFLADAAGVADALRAAARPGFLTPVERARLENAFPQLGAVGIASARTVCMNNQRTHVFSAILGNYLADMEVSADMLDPVIGQFGNGLTMDVAPVVSHDRSRVRLELRLTATYPADTLRSLVVQAAPASLAGTASVDTSSEKEGKKTSVSVSSSIQSASYVAGPARVQEVRLVNRRVRTDVFMPDGATAYFTLATSGGDRGAAKTLLFLVRARTLEWGGA